MFSSKYGNWFLQGTGRRSCISLYGRENGCLNDNPKTLSQEFIDRLQNRNNIQEGWMLVCWVWTALVSAVRKKPFLVCLIHFSCSVITDLWRIGVLKWQTGDKWLCMSRVRNEGKHKEWHFSGKCDYTDWANPFILPWTVNLMKWKDVMNSDLNFDDCEV